jgi:predicted nucleotidyltransferase
MIQDEFIGKAKNILREDEQIVGLAVAGSHITKELDEFSDVDLILVTRNRVSQDKNAMLNYAKRLGNFISGFTGEHVGEPRLLICLYDEPLLHVDIKFVTIEEFHTRIETPEIVFDRSGELAEAIRNSTARFPYPDYQWIEDRFWTWVHYALLKIRRGELLEAYDFFGTLRMMALGPLIHIKNKNLPRGVRRVETSLPAEDLKSLLATVPQYDRESLLTSLHHAVKLYRELRAELFDEKVVLQKVAEEKVMEFFKDTSVF